MAISSRRMRLSSLVETYLSRATRSSMRRIILTVVSTPTSEVMKKVMPEAPDEVMLVLDGSTGQNAFEQAKQFSAVTNISSLAITKLDGTAKGGVVIGISDQLKVPVKYIGLGEGMEDLQLFNKTEFVDSLFKN